MSGSRIIVLVVAFLFSTTHMFSSYGQTKSFNLGVEGGVGYSAYDYSNPVDIWDVGGDVSFNSMIFGLMSLNPQISIQSGLRYSRLGNHVDIIGDENTGHFKVKLNYLSLPLRVRYTFAEVPIYLTVGPEPGYLLSAESLITTGNVTNSDIITGDLNRFDLALYVGSGVLFKVGGNQLFIQAGFERGITGVAESENWASNWFVNEVSLIAGVIF